MTTQQKNLIRSIYLYVFTAIGLGMVIFSAFFLVQYATKKLFLPKYYLEWQETRCDYIAPVPMEGNSKMASADAEKQKKECLQKLEEERRSKEILDFSSSLTMLLLGGAVFIFHYRKTKEN